MNRWISSGSWANGWDFKVDFEFFFSFSFAVAHVINDIVFKKMVKVKRCGGGPGGNC